MSSLATERSTVALSGGLESWLTALGLTTLANEIICKTAYCLLAVAFSKLSVVYCLLFIVCLSIVVDCLLFIDSCLLSVVLPYDANAGPHLPTSVRVGALPFVPR